LIMWRGLRLIFLIAASILLSIVCVVSCMMTPVTRNILRRNMARAIFGLPPSGLVQHQLIPPFCALDRFEDWSFSMDLTRKLMTLRMHWPKGFKAVFPQLTA